MYQLTYHDGEDTVIASRDVVAYGPLSTLLENEEHWEDVCILTNTETGERIEGTPGFLFTYLTDA